MKIESSWLILNFTNIEIANSTVKLLSVPIVFFPTIHPADMRATGS